MKTLTAKERGALKEIEEYSDTIENRMFGAMYYKAVYDRIVHEDDTLWRFVNTLEHTPVSIEEFLDGSDFFGASPDLEIWPEVRQTIIEVNQDWWKGTKNNAHDQGLLMGATGTAKTTIAMASTAYHTHILLCMKNPQAFWGLSKPTSIVFAILAANPNVMKKVVYLPLRKYIEAMPWFQKHGLPDKQLDNEMNFVEKNIRIIPAGGDESAILGEAIIGGIEDEANFMDVVLKSKKAVVSTGRTGVYDRAQQIFETMLRRKGSRFSAPPNSPAIGICFCSSSTRYKGDYTDKRKKLIDAGKIKSCYVYNRKQYDVWPQHRYEKNPDGSLKTFDLVIGNEVVHDTRVLREGERMPPGAHIEHVPIFYKEAFETNPYDSLRDIIGISSNALSPFIRTRYKVSECVDLGEEEGLTSFLENDNVILGVDGMPRVVEGHYCQNPSRPRFVHIDLSRNGDRCGIAMVCFAGVKTIRRSNGATDTLPVGRVEMACSIEPDANNEIDVAEVRAFVAHLKNKYGYPIKVVSYDNVDSRESIQTWRKQGMRSMQLSVDHPSTRYKQFRDAIYDGRILLLNNPILIEEILNLEYDEPKDKIDHPLSGSKDVSDAVCGAYSSMLERKATWESVMNDDLALSANQRALFDSRFDAPRR